MSLCRHNVSQTVAASGFSALHPPISQQGAADAERVARVWTKAVSQPATHSLSIHHDCVITSHRCFVIYIDCESQANEESLQLSTSSAALIMYGTRPLQTVRFLLRWMRLREGLTSVPTLTTFWRRPKTELIIHS